MKLSLFVIPVIGFAAVVLAATAEVKQSGEDWDLAEAMNGFTFQRAKALSLPTPDRTSLRLSRLRNLKGHVAGHSATSVLGRAGRTPRISAAGKFQNISSIGGYSTQYAVQCSWDGKPLWLLFDTGSSDTWAVESGFVCEDSVGIEHPQAACAFGKSRVGHFGHEAIDELHIFLSYGSGERISGPMGYSDISCGGLSVSSQQVGLANRTYWHGNNVTVGILGLAYPSMTSAYYGQVGDETSWNSITYTPFLTSAIAQGAIDSVFSVAIMRNSSDGILAWGGLPPMKWNRSRNATTDLIVAKLGKQDETSWRYSYYTIIPDGVAWGMTVDTTKYPYIVDTGTTMMYLPPPLAEAIAMAFEPRAVYLYQWGMYFAPCDALAPQFAVIISGVKFWVDPADMINQQLVDPLTGYCAIAVASGGSGPYILGDVFLQNVVAVFDVGGAQMRFYSHE